MSFFPKSRWLGYFLVGVLCFGLGVGVAWLTPSDMSASPATTMPALPEEAAPAEQGLTGEVATPKNVILFVGDGMSMATVVAARILEGQLAGSSGEENLLSFESFPSLGLAKTYNVDSQVPDSAGTMTAMMTGRKTDIGVIGVGPEVERGQCDSVAGNELESWMMVAERTGVLTGIVTTTRVTHATPAAVYAISPERGWESDGDIPDRCRSYSYGDIASQLLAFDRFGDGFEVVLGGGSRELLPESDDGNRLDGRNLIDEWNGGGPSWASATTREETLELDLGSVNHLLGIYAPSHLAYEVDRLETAPTQPSLSQMTTLAIGQLTSGEYGFALVVEAGRIDHAHHATNAYRALTETIALADAVEAAMQLVDLSETLIVVTADHGHVFTIGGYPERGNDILGFVNDAEDAHGEPYRTLGYANSRVAGFAHDHNEDGVIDADDGVFGVIGSSPQDVGTQPGVMDRAFRQGGLVELGSETHSGEDVLVYASGPLSSLLDAVFEQDVIGQLLLSVFTPDE